MEPFVINVPEADLDDLQCRIKNTRWAPDFGNDKWAYGANGDFLRSLVDYWLNTYDWRTQETKINSFPQFRTVIDDVPVHFIHVRGNGPNPTPLILNHGWPWTFWDMHKIIRPLTDPVAFGGNADDAFDIVVPSLPGYGFSTPLTKTGVNFHNTADLWVKLMQDVLGYEKFASYGGDWGALISSQLGHKYADRLVGVHMSLMAPLDLLNGGTGGQPEDFSAAETAWSDKNQRFFEEEAGYYFLQCTKPQTPAFALNDSPVGLAAWLVEKRRTWSHCGTDVESRFSKDDLLTTVMIYWLTQSYGTSARYYYEAAHHAWQPSHDRHPVVEAPTGLAVFHNEVLLQPRKWAERYYNLQRWTEYPSGGHFAPMEEPEILTRDIQEFFRPLRGSS